MPLPLIPVQTGCVFGWQQQAGRMPSQTFKHPGFSINLDCRSLLVSVEWTAFKSQHEKVLRSRFA